MEQRKIGISSQGLPTHYSAGVIIVCRGKYLLLDRKNIPFGFACPTGHVDEGEAPSVAAIREVQEETGVVLNEVALVAEEEIDWNYCRSTIVHYWYLYRAAILDDTLVFNKEETKSLGWYTPEEIKRLDLEPVWKYWLEKMNII